MTTNTRRLLSASIAASAAWLGAASAADAANITYDRTSNSYFVVDVSGGQGLEINSVTARLQSGKVVLSDTATPLTSSTSRCVIVAGTAQCPTDGAFQFFLRGGNDTLDYRIPQAGQADLGDGVDALFGSHRQFGPASATFLVTGGAGFDYAVFTEAVAGVTITDNDTAPDGVPGQNYSVSNFEGYAGSAFADRILASPEADVITPGGGDDTVGAGVGDDVIVSQSRDGADDIHGGPGSDWIHYSGRSQGITLASNELADDGEPFERDFIRTNVENAVGTDHDDRIFGTGAANRYQGAAGNDRIEGAGGADTLTGASGIDTLIGDTGNDTIDARDNERDIVSCGADADLALRDAVEAKVSGCETDQVGTLVKAAPVLKAAATPKVR